MQNSEIIQNIKQGIAFETFSEDSSFYIKVDKYVPYVCTAIHAGHNLRKSFIDKILLTDYERWFEEDPVTDVFIKSLPITIVANDSRFEYDLNRNREDCVYETAWGKKVWKTSISNDDKNISLQKFDDFYQIIDELITKLKEIHKNIIVYDIHSYNLRGDESKPVFNIGTERINNIKYDKYTEFWKKELSKIEFVSVESRAAINEVFYGKGYFLKHITTKFENTLVLATEVSKIYCNENTAVLYPVIIENLQKQLKTAILNNTKYFIDNQENKTINYCKLLSEIIEPAIFKVDKEFYEIVKNFELLEPVNPINLEAEKKKFFESGRKKNPKFIYRPVNFNRFQFKRNLYNIDVDKISDINIKNMYKNTINGFASQADMLYTIGQKDFLYNSLRYLGEPNHDDYKKARYLVSVPNIETEEDKKNLTAEDAYEEIKKCVDSYGFECKYEFHDHSVAEAYVVSNDNTIVLKKNGKFTKNETRILANHEVGVHIVTTMNAKTQPLRIFQIGLPVNTYTQEGLAVFSEYMSNSMNIKRLRVLGLRVLATEQLIKGKDFKQIFDYICEEYDVESNYAFYIVTRIVRGGGFTKDHLYLSGFSMILNHWHQGKPLNNLLVGKTSIKYLDTITEMIERKMITPPKYITKAFENSQNTNNIINYLVKGLIDK